MHIEQTLPREPPLSSFFPQNELMLTATHDSATSHCIISHPPAVRSERTGSNSVPFDKVSRNTSLNRFPFSNFKHYLTLFSKFFASFPHGTFSLSVSRQYLALDEIYHPFSAAFPNNTTRWRQDVTFRSPSHIRDSHPLCWSVPRHLGRGRQRTYPSKLQFAATGTEILNLCSSLFTRRY